MRHSTDQPIARLQVRELKFLKLLRLQWGCYSALSRENDALEKRGFQPPHRVKCPGNFSAACLPPFLIPPVCACASDILHDSTLMSSTGWGAVRVRACVRAYACVAWIVRAAARGHLLWLDMSEQNIINMQTNACTATYDTRSRAGSADSGPAMQVSWLDGACHYQNGDHPDYQL